MNPETPVRKFLGKCASVLTRTEVYLRPDGFEVDDRSLISFRRTWILFDEVTFVTLHPARAWAGAILAGFFGVIFGVVGGLIVAFEDATPEISLVPFGFAAIFLVIALVALVVPRWTVTIQGLRSRAAMIRSNRGKSQELYDETVRLVAAGRGRRETETPLANIGVQAPPGPSEPPIIAYEPS